LSRERCASFRVAGGGGWIRQVCVLEGIPIFIVLLTAAAMAMVRMGI
jgi:hypothetical protein